MNALGRFTRLKSPYYSTSEDATSRFDAIPRINRMAQALSLSVLSTINKAPVEILGRQFICIQATSVYRFLNAYQIPINMVPRHQASFLLHSKHQPCFTQTPFFQTLPTSNVFSFLFVLSFPMRSYNCATLLFLFFLLVVLVVQTCADDDGHEKKYKYDYKGKNHKSKCYRDPDLVCMFTPSILGKTIGVIKFTAVPKPRHYRMHGYPKHLRKRKCLVEVDMAMVGLTPGSIYSIQIREFGDRRKPDGSSAGALFDDNEHTVSGFHSGDLGNIVATGRGAGLKKFYDVALRLDEIVGRSIIIEELPGIDGNVQSVATKEKGHQLCVIGYANPSLNNGSLDN